MAYKGAYIVQINYVTISKNFAGFSLSFHTALLLHFTNPCVPETER